MLTAMETGMAASSQHEHIISRVSTASLDIQTILSSCSVESGSLLSTHFSFTSTSSSSQSFDDVPPFPPQSHTYSRLQSSVGPLGILQIPILSDVFDAYNWDSQDATPTSRIVQDFRKGVTPVDITHSMNGYGTDTEMKPSRSSTVVVARDSASPDPFCCTPRSSLESATSVSSTSSYDHVTAANLTTMGDMSLINMTSTATGLMVPNNHTEPVSHPGGVLLVPTIMVSSSTAALSLSRKSSHNVGSHQEVPLAVRRGMKPPPTLSLGQQVPDMSECSDSDSYPDIPSAFLGRSPTSSLPASPSLPSGPLAKPDIGLSTMCTNLKALVPRPPFTPTETEYCTPPPQPLPSLELETMEWAIAASAQLQDADDEEWGFVHGLVLDWHADQDASPPPSPIREAAYTAIDSPGSDRSMRESMVSFSPPTLESNHSRPDASDKPQSVQTAASAKQMRRKTVIIQAPDGDSQLVPANAERFIHMDKPDSDHGVDRLLDQFDEPVPFEIPAASPCPTPVSVESSFFTPPSSRPSSTASSARFPPRGILKEKKSVRFSAVPSLYEYIASSNDESRDQSSGSSKHHSDTDILSALRRFPMLHSAPHKSSPLRKVHLSDDNGSEERIASLPAANTTLETGSAPGKTVPTQSPSPTVRTALTSKTSPTAKQPLTTMAKHPAVRALACKPLSARQPVSPTLIVGSGAGGAVMGAPSLQSPYSRMPSPPRKGQDERRVALRPVNMRQSAPAERKAVSASQSPVKETTPRTSTRRGPTVSPESIRRPGADKGKENAVLRTGAGPNTPRRMTVGVSSGTHLRASLRPTAAWGGGGTSATAEAMASQKNVGVNSRMPVPLRNIFTKLRA